MDMRVRQGRSAPSPQAVRAPVCPMEAAPAPKREPPPPPQPGATLATQAVPAPEGGAAVLARSRPTPFGSRATRSVRAASSSLAARAVSASLALAALTAACASGIDDRAAVTTVRDTVVVHDGADVVVRITENPSDRLEVPEWRLGETPEWAVGGIDVSEELALFRVAGAYRLSDGRTVVADGGSTRLKVFGRDGALVDAIGGRGEGPGEFRRIDHFARLPGDSLVVWDLGLARVTVFDPAGAAVRTVRIGSEKGSPSSYVVGVFADGSLLARGFIDLGGTVPSGLRFPEAPLLRLAADGTLADSLGPVPTSEMYYVPIEGGISFYAPPFARSTEVVAAGDRLYLGETGRAELRVHRPDGTPERFIRWSHPSRPVDAAAMARAREHALEESGSAIQRQNIERMFRDVPMPSTMPAFARLRVDEGGDVWIEEYRPPWEEGDGRWLVFGAGGRLRARVTMPAGFEPTQIGPDFVLGIARDEFDVEQLRLYRLHRSGAPRRPDRAAGS